jgi:hypothetical protein
VQPKPKRNSGKDYEDDQGYPPLEPARASGTLNTLVQLTSGSLGIALDLFSLLLGSLDQRLLVDDLLVKLREEECQLAHGLFDALDVIVSGADGTENAGGLAGAVGFEL